MDAAGDRVGGHSRVSPVVRTKARHTLFKILRFTFLKICKSQDCSSGFPLENLRFVESILRFLSICGGQNLEIFFLEILSHKQHTHTQSELASLYG